MTVAYLLSDDVKSQTTTQAATAYFLAWIYDTAWLEQLSEALKTVSHRHSASIAFTMLYFYIMQFFFKNVIHRLFVSVIIEGSLQLDSSL